MNPDGADGLIVSGSATGSAANLHDFVTIRTAVPEAPLFAGSGITSETVKRVLEHTDGVIIGTSVKVGGQTTAPVDPRRARALVEAAAG